MLQGHCSNLVTWYEAWGVLNVFPYIWIAAACITNTGQDLVGLVCCCVADAGAIDGVMVFAWNVLNLWCSWWFPLTHRATDARNAVCMDIGIHITFEFTWLGPGVVIRAAPCFASPGIHSEGYIKCTVAFTITLIPLIVFECSECTVHIPDEVEVQAASRLTRPGVIPFPCLIDAFTLARNPLTILKFWDEDIVLP